MNTINDRLVKNIPHGETDTVENDITYETQHAINDKKIGGSDTPLKIKRHNYTKNKRFRTLLLILILLISWTCSLFIETKASKAQDIQKGIASEIIRFHVIANSDSNEDQALKLKVKDALVEELSPDLKSAKDINEARVILKGNLPAIKEKAEEIIRYEGYEYPVTVSLESCYFPLKVYDDYTFPPGTYEALRVQIGEAQGHNWWCVMFPPLCFVDETYGIVDKETDRKLKYLLTEKEYDSLKSHKVPVKVRFKIWEKIKKLFVH